ncbi:TfoX/Sxy family protein [Desulfosporosinus acididurans]|nr:TfoX/Sxy family protein [Desulfosporosinus acididurans]
MVMPYYEVPVDILENREQLAEWAMKVQWYN